MAERFDRMAGALRGYDVADALLTALDIAGFAVAADRSMRSTERQGTHWEGCWRAHHECAVSLLDKIFREETVGYDQAHRLLAEAKAALVGRCEVHNGSPCADCGAIRADGLLVAPLYPYGGAFGYGPPAPAREEDT